VKTWSPEFSRALHRAARREIFTSTEWKRAYWRTYHTDLLGLVFVVFFFVLIVALPLLIAYDERRTISGPPEREFQWAFHWYATELLALGGLTLGTLLKSRRDIVWQRLPRSPKSAFALGARDFSVGWLLIASVAGTYILSLGSFFSTGEWRTDFAAVGGLTFGLSIVACGYPLTWLASLEWQWRKPKPARPSPALGVVVFSIFAAGFVGPSVVAHHATEWGIADWFGPLSESLPGAWTGRLVFEGLANGQWVTGSHWLPLGVMLALAPLWHQLLSRRFCALAPDLFAPVLAEPPAIPEAEANPLQAVREAMTEPARWMRGGVAERLVGLWLRPAEHRLAALIFAGTPSWTTGLRRLHLWVFVALVAGWWLLRDRSNLSVGAALLCFGFAALMLLANSIFNSGFGAALGGLARTPNLPVFLPLDARQYARVWLKVIWLRSLLTLPLCLLTGLVLEALLWKLMKPFTVYAVVLWLIGPVLAPVAPIFRLVISAPVTRWWQVGKPVLIGVAMILILYCPILAVVLAAKFGHERVLVAEAGVAVVLLGILRLTTLAYERGWIDVQVAQPRLLTNQQSQRPPLQITIG
jgi:hypothetical protein